MKIFYILMTYMGVIDNIRFLLKHEAHGPHRLPEQH